MVRRSRPCPPAVGVSTTFTPNGDGVSDTVATSVTTNEAGTMAVRVADDTDTTVRTFSVDTTAGTNAFTWDGKSRRDRSFRMATTR